MKRYRARLFVAVLGASLPAVSSAQIPTLMIRDGDDPGVPGQTVDHFRGSRVLPSGGYAFLIETEGAVPSLNLIWGSPDGLSAPVPWFVQGVHAGITQTAWDTQAWGVDPLGNFLYVTQTPGGEALFKNDVVLCGLTPLDNDGDGAPDPGVFAELIRDLGVDADYAYAEIRDSVSGLFGFYRMPHRDSPEIYCSAKASSSNCLAQIGTASPSTMPVLGAADYAVTCTEVEGARPGLFFFGTLGPLAAPFQGGDAMRAAAARAHAGAGVRRNSRYLRGVVDPDRQRPDEPVGTRPRGWVVDAGLLPRSGSERRLRRGAVRCAALDLLLRSWASRSSASGLAPWPRRLGRRDLPRG